MTTKKTQKSIMLETVAPGSNNMPNEILALSDQAVDGSLVEAFVEAFMMQYLLENKKIENGVIQEIVNDGFGFNLNDQEANQVVTNLAEEGIDSWSKLFASAIIEIDEELSILLDDCAEASEQQANLLAELGKESDYDGSQAVNTVRAWFSGISGSKESLTVAINVIKDFVNTLLMSCFPQKFLIY